uniref:Phosphodiesterase n=1 Tax=Lutzomyia longipalpis TaxID=7200 RepID=A0A1B0CY76_LUTLO
MDPTAMWSTVTERVVNLWKNRASCNMDRNTKVNGVSQSDDPMQQQVVNYLRNHPDFLEHYLMEEVEIEQMERWMIRRIQRSKKQPQQQQARKTSLSRWRFCVHADKRQMLQDLTHSLQLRPTRSHVLWELGSCISSAVGADGFRLYLTDTANPEQLSLYLDHDTLTEDGEPRLHKIKSGLTVPQYVARTREPVRLTRGDVDARFPEGITNKDTAHILCQAVVQPDGQLVAVLELWRHEHGTPFHEEDEEIAYSYLVWGAIAIHYAHLFLNMNKQRKLNDFLLAVVKSIFQDMVSMDMLVMKVMNFAQRLVDADRASLFLVDAKSKELYATIFDVGKAEGEDETHAPSTPKEIRFPLGTGIAGQVALTGEVLNIADAYSDSRFNRSIDQITGYRTESILSMPIFIRGNVIGVVQMVNKHSGYFTKEDEEAFETFAIYCGLALHHAKLYDKIRRSEQKYRVALEVLSYHNTCTEEEVRQCIDKEDGLHVDLLQNYYFSAFEYDDFQKVQFAICMFTDLFGLSRFDKMSLIRFTLTVKKNYRRVPYHNWTHGFSVANTMYSILKRSKGVFKSTECLALFIGSLCHDLDHRGKNNKFMLDSESPLAAMYSTSTMEHHHFNQTVAILQQEGHNIFSKLSNSEYKQVLGLVKHCILATDLALFFPNKARLSQLVAEDKFSWNILEHRILLQAIAMTASDLSASAKPWDIQCETVKVIFEEFYQQGDEERSLGRQPMAMMDRNKPDEQASSQVGFITGICIPCYSLLQHLLPDTQPLLDMCQQNLDKWQKLADEVRSGKSINILQLNRD